MKFDDYLLPMPLRAYGPMPEADYRAFPAVSATILKKRTQAEMLHEKCQPPTESTEALTMGALLHNVVLEPWKFGQGEFAKHFVIWEETKSLDAKAAEAGRRANPGKLLITVEMVELAAQMRSLALEQSPRIVQLLSAPNGLPEASLIGYDPTFQIRRKIRVDYLPRTESNGRMCFGNYLLDIKTTRNHVAEFEKEAWSYGYYLQAAYYLDTHELFTGHRPDWFYFLVVSKAAPVMARVYGMRNLKLTDPLYEKSKLKIARETLGLDPTGRPGRLTMFAAAASEHAAQVADSASAAELRRTWSAYEGEDIIEIL